MYFVFCIQVYNNERHHDSLDNMTPAEYRRVA
ncbi:IS3 family transposase [Psychrobacter sp. ER1]